MKWTRLAFYRAVEPGRQVVEEILGESESLEGFASRAGEAVPAATVDDVFVFREERPLAARALEELVHF